jgi:hypothetical protein
MPDLSLGPSRAEPRTERLRLRAGEQIGRWAPVLAVVAAAAVLLALGSSNAPWGRAAAWAVCVLVAFVGWGGLVERLVGDGAPAGWALRAVWGIAAVLVVGGPLAALHLASKPVLLAQVIVGLLLAAYRAFVQWAQTRGESEPRARVYVEGVALLVLVTYGFAIVHFFGYLGSNVFQLSDDGPLYFLFSEKLLQTGSIYEPFSVRRLLTYGGQSYIHALYLTVAPHGFLHVIDGGLGFAIVAGLLLGEVSARPSHAELARVWLAVTLLVTLPPIVRTNTASLMTGCALFLGIYQTLRRPWRDCGSPGRRSSIAGAGLVGALVATAGLLRTSHAIPAAVFAGLGLLPPVRELLGRAPRRSALRTQAIFAVCALIALIPWLLLFRESCGTAIYPLQSGSLTPGFVLLKSKPSLFANLQSLLDHVFYERPLINLPLFILAALLPSVGNDRIARAASWSTLLGFCALIYAGGAFDPYNNSRYYFGFVTSFALIMALTVRRSETVAERVPTGVRDVVIVVAVLASLVVGPRGDLANHYKGLLEMARRGYRDTASDARASEAKTRAYRELQSHMEVGAKAVMMVDEPFRFDLRRNEMLSLDIGGGMGPSPGYPAFKGAEALASYLVSHGVRYIVYVDFAHSAQLYLRRDWQNHLAKTGYFLQGEAPYMLDAMNSIEALAASRTVVHSQDWMNLVDLNRSRAQ